MSGKGRRPARKGSSRRKKRGSRARRGGSFSLFVRLLGAGALAVSAALIGFGLGRGAPAGVDAALDLPTWSGERVRVQVLNGGGVPGMAAAATERLRDAGFDVVDFGNASSFDPDRASEVIDRVGRPDVSQAVAAALGIDNVQSDPNPNLYVDVTVVLGGAWTPETRSNPVGSEIGQPTWDPRSWFGN